MCIRDRYQRRVRGTIYPRTMGQSASDMAAKMQQAQNEAEARAKSEMAQLTATLKAKESEFLQKLVTPNNADKTLPIDTIVKLNSQIRVDVSTAPSDKMKGLVEDMFGGNFLKALKGLILGVLDTLLGNAQVGASEKQGYAVILLHSAIVRVDYFAYTYTLRSDGATTHVQNGLAFAVSMSTVKLVDVNSEAIALLSGLTAEGQASAMDQIIFKFKDIEGNIASKPDMYPTASALGMIRGYFWDYIEKDQAQKDALTALQEHANKATTPEEEEKARKDANDMLLAKITEYQAKWERIPESQIAMIQNELLDAMIAIYDKISKMKLATQKSIAEAEGRSML
eukprot:TRINITY_DN3368_c0_g1_i1.p1 TRINITY_DN3368_c0_g1~~TRINITY_DN3368_c0_g1_i1.p1  ORF type:complete len:340 (+),score=105.25 TRINITY_DN3368_c0_g1_i1:131-1150(+)